MVYNTAKEGKLQGGDSFFTTNHTQRRRERRGFLTVSGRTWHRCCLPR